MVIITVVRALRQQGIHEKGPITRHADTQNAGNPSIENGPRENAYQNRGSSKAIWCKETEVNLVQMSERLCSFTVLRTNSSTGQHSREKTSNLSCHVKSRFASFFKIHNQVPFFGCKKKEKIDPAQVHTSHILLNVSKGKSRLFPPQNSRSDKVLHLSLWIPIC